MDRSIAIFLTIPMQFLRMLQILKSFLENMGAGRLLLKTKHTRRHKKME